MKCFRCGRAISTASAVIPASKGQPFRYGPKCARLAGLIEPKTRAPRPRLLAMQQVAPDPNQLVLELGR